MVSALTSSNGGPDDNAAQAGHLVTHTHTFQKVIRSGARDVNGDLPPEVWAEREVAATLNCGDNTSESRATELVVQAVHENQRGELTVSETAGSLKTGGGKPGQGYPCVSVSPLAVRGREGGAQIEVGPEGGPYNALRAAAVSSATTVRRLTPVECERLQGFPDNWTAASNGKPQADSPRYKQLGNAEAVPVVQWIVDRIFGVESGAL